MVHNLVAVMNQFVSAESRNKVFTKKIWLTVHVCISINSYMYM